jgi:hypothetical protein
MSTVPSQISKYMGSAVKLADIWGSIIYNVKDTRFAGGAKGDGITDDTAAIQAAINEVGKYGGIVYFPPGSYKVTSTIYIRKNNIVLQGSGPDSTTIFAVGDYGDTFVFEPSVGLPNILSVGVNNMRFYTASDTTNGAFIACSMVYQSFFSNLIITEKFGGVLIKGGANQFWDNIQITSDALWSAVKTTSYLLKLTKFLGTTTISPLPGEIFFNNMNLRGSSSKRYVQNAMVIEAGDGIWINNSHIGFVNSSCLQVKHGGDDYTIGGLEVSNTWFDFGQYGVAFVDVPTAFAFNGYNAFSNCLFVGHTVSGILCSDHGMMGLSFTGCHIGRTDSHAVQLLGGKNISFTGCHIFDTKNLAAGIQIAGTTSDISISDSKFYISNTGTYTMGNAIVMTDSVDYVNISGATFKNTTTSDISDGSTGKNKKVIGTISDKEILNVSASVGGDLFLPITYDIFKLTGANNVGSIATQTTVKGRRVTLIGTGVLSIFATNNIKLSATFNVTDLDTITLICDGTNWFEVSRSVN